MSAYNYSFNNPVNLRDKTGKWPTPWDLADFGFAVQSVAAAWNDPSASNIGWAAADVVAAALPIVPSTAYVRGAAEAAEQLAKRGTDAIASVKVANQPFAKQSDGQLRKSVSSLRENVAEHKRKIEDYISDPDAFDNKGILEGKSPEVREKIIQGRVKALRSQLKKNQNELRKAQGELLRRDLVRNQN